MEKRKEILKTKILYFQNMLPVKLIERELSLPVGSGKIVTVTGGKAFGKNLLIVSDHQRNCKKWREQKAYPFFVF